MTAKTAEKEFDEAFLPEDYEIPAKENNYMKFSEEENRFRVLGSAIHGWELWVKEEGAEKAKPIRRHKDIDFTSEERENADVNRFTGKKKIPQYFWAFPVWNYQTEKVEILEVTQTTVMEGIEDYLDDPDYGADPKQYDLVVTRDDSGEITKYRVKAKPPKPMEDGMMEMYKEMNIQLDALFEGKDPFNPDRD